MKIKKVLFLVIVTVMLLTLFTSFASFAEIDVGDTITKMQNSKITDTDGVESGIGNLGSTIVFTIQLVGTMLGVIMLIFFGIKWMTANPNRKSELKEEAWNYIIGAALLFGAGTIAQWIFDIVTKLGTGNNA